MNLGKNVNTKMPETTQNISSARQINEELMPPNLDKSDIKEEQNLF